MIAQGTKMQICNNNRQWIAEIRKYSKNLI